MLVLTRLQGESIHIYHKGEVLVIRVNRIQAPGTDKARVKLGLSAPDSFEIVRSEVGPCDDLRET